MFVVDLQLMMVYELLWIIKRWNKEDFLQIKNWKRNVFDFFKGILSCKFVESLVGIRFFLKMIKRWSGVYVNNVFQFFVFCFNGICIEFVSNFSYVDEVCLIKYKYSVIKIGELRILDNLILLFFLMFFIENLDMDIRVIQFVCDFRVSMYLRIKLGWMVDFYYLSFLNNVRKVCLNLVKNIRFGCNLGQWWVKYFEVYYRDFVGKFLEMIEVIYKFVGFEMLDSICEWVICNILLSKEELWR